MVPTVGRIVWFYPGEDSEILAGEKKCLGAMVQEVHDIGVATVTVAGVGLDGVPFCVEGIALLDPSTPDLDPDIGGYATWMPYQVAQAAKESGK
jgi:hypothetical protein